MSQQHRKVSLTKAISAYFQQGEKKDVKTQKVWETNKMGEVGKEQSMGVDMPSKADLQEIAGKIEILEN